MKLDATSARLLRHVLFFGTVLSPEDCRANPVCSEAGNNFQLNLLDGLLHNGVDQVTALSVLSLESFPRNRCLFVTPRVQRIGDRLELRVVPFLNLATNPVPLFVGGNASPHPQQLP